MTSLRCCTLTGVDEHTDLEKLATLSVERPLVEWAVLYSEERSLAKDPRYPRAEWISEFADSLEYRPLPTSLHICGKDAMLFLGHDEKIWEIASKFDRVQLNVTAKTNERGSHLSNGMNAGNVGAVLHRFTFSNGHGPVILAHNFKNQEFLAEMTRSYSCNALFDASGGRGIMPGAWPEARDTWGLKIGYAGGLGPDNIAQQLPLIDAASCEKTFWIDMENKLRNGQDRFDLESASKVLDVVSEYVLRSALVSGQGVQKHHELFGPRVENLSGLSLDWWAGVAGGYNMNIPPVGASRATYFNRISGVHRGFSPGEHAADLNGAMHEFDIGCVKRDGVWEGVTTDGATGMRGATRAVATLRTLVAETLGDDLPVNPASHPVYMARLVGDNAAAQFGSAILSDIDNDKVSNKNLRSAHRGP